jgi:hypothetical protein
MPPRVHSTTEMHKNFATCIRCNAKNQGEGFRNRRAPDDFWQLRAFQADREAMTRTTMSACGRFAVLDGLHLDRNVFEFFMQCASARGLQIQDAIQLAPCVPRRHSPHLESAAGIIVVVLGVGTAAMR